MPNHFLMLNCRLRDSAHLIVFLIKKLPRALSVLVSPDGLTVTLAM